MIFLFQRILTHYQIPVYEKLNRIMDNRLVLIYGQSVKESHFFDGKGCNFSFKNVQVRNIWFSGERFLWQNFWKPFQLYGTPNAVIMEQSPRIISLFFLYFYCKIRKIPFILWGHGGSRRRSISESKNIKDKIHRSLIRKSSAFICYTDGIKNELSRVIETQKLFVARNTLDTESLFSIRNMLAKEGKKSVKEKLGLKRKKYICFIGRLLPSKQVDYLIDVYEIVKKAYQDSGLLIIGDGPDKNYLEKYVLGKEIEDIHFLGGISNWQHSGQYLYASDILVIPGDVGLAVNHAFCFGLPVITQAGDKNGPFHGPEIEYIIHGKTGFICEKGNKKEMSQAIIKVFNNGLMFNSKVTKFCKNNLSIDEMVYGVKKAIDFAMSHNKKKSNRKFKADNRNYIYN